jgi:hypothetical protein
MRPPPPSDTPPAVTGTPASNVPEASQTPAPPTEPDSNALPPTREISVVREGLTDVFTGTLYTSEQGYAIYLLPDYVLLPADPAGLNQDLIQPNPTAGVEPASP